MGFFSDIFGKKKKEQKADTSRYLASKKDPKELHFARVFTEKGGKFIFSENVEQTRNYFHQILAENGWGSADLKSDSKSLNSFFNIPVNSEVSKNKNPLALVANRIAKNYEILFIDEFQIEDIADAMIIGSVIESLVSKGIRIMLSSNAHPFNCFSICSMRSKALFRTSFRSSICCCW